MSNTANGKQEQRIKFTRSDDAALLAALCLPDHGQEQIQLVGTAEREAVLRAQVSKIKLKDELDTLQSHRTDDTDANLTPSAIVSAYQSLGIRSRIAIVAPLTVDPEETVENVSAVEEVLEQRASIEEREEETFNRQVRTYNGTNTETAQIKSVYNQTVRELRLRQNSDLRRHRYEQAVLQYLGDSFLKKQQDKRHYLGSQGRKAETRRQTPVL